MEKRLQVQWKAKPEKITQIIKKYGLVTLAAETGVSQTWLRQASAGTYHHFVNRTIRTALCGFTGLKESALFSINREEGAPQ